MTVSLIAAVDGHLLLGNESGIPWRLSADLKRFRKLTLGKPIVMGRTTFEHIGKALDRRTNIVLSRHSHFEPTGALVARTTEEAIHLANSPTPVDEVMVIGGGKVYQAFLPFATRLYLTFVDGDYRGNAWFPGQIKTPAGHRWVVRQREHVPATADGQPAHDFVWVDQVEDSSIDEHELEVLSLRTAPLEQ